MAAAIPFLKLDDGSEGFASNCFPVRAVINQTEDGRNICLQTDISVVMIYVMLCLDSEYE